MAQQPETTSVAASDKPQGFSKWLGVALGLVLILAASAFVLMHFAVKDNTNSAQTQTATPQPTQPAPSGAPTQPFSAPQQ